MHLDRRTPGRSAPFAAGLAAGLVAAFSPAAAADGRPILLERGQVAFSAQASLQRFETPHFESLRLFVDDRLVTGDGTITATGHRGSLLRYDTDSWEPVPEVSFSVGLRDGIRGERYRGAVRLEGRARVWRRELEEEIGGVQPALDGFSVEPPGGPTTEVGLFAYYGSIDGGSAGGLLTGFLSQAPVTGARLELEEAAGSGELVLWFDALAVDGWQVSTGLGLSYAYADQAFEQSFVLDTVGPYAYDYDVRSHRTGLALEMAVGKELLGHLTVFGSGSFRPGYLYGKLDGRQQGFCLAGAVCTAVPQTVSGDDSHESLAWDARASGGLALRLWRLVLSAEAGVNATNGYLMPVEDETGGGSELESLKAWGWFGRAGVTFLLF